MSEQHIEQETIKVTWDDGTEREYPFRLPLADTPEQIFDRLETIIDNEQLIHNTYIASKIAPVDVRQLCGGHYFCAIGSVFFAAGAPITASWEYPDEENEAERGRMVLAMPDTYSIARLRMMRTNPALHDVMDALDEVAAERIASGDYVRRRRLITHEEFGDTYSPFEVFFEDFTDIGPDGEHRDYDTMRAVVQEARERIGATA